MDQVFRYSAQLLRDIREQQGLSKNAFAKAIGMDTPAYLRYEQGKHAISSNKLAEIGEKFGVTLGWINHPH